MVTATVGDGRPSIPVIAQSGDTPCYEARQSIPKPCLRAPQVL
ncbi:MAG: hypothetical protein ACFNXW_09000 [Rothia dentocariosa]|nr:MULTISPECIES: hypothetical protein [Rothia]